MKAGELVGGRFELLEELGAGGMGVVWRARDGLDQRLVAIKLLPIDAEAEARARFDREAALLASLEHPGVVRHVAHGRAGERTAFLAMELLDGIDLATTEPLSVDDALTVVRHAAEALGYAHSLGIVHRDVKPANIFLVGGRPAEVRVLDFGIARPGPDATAMTRSGFLVGTPAYMAPEQARGERDLDARVDVFALGCVLFELLTGKPAFDGPSPVAVLARVVFAEPPRLRALRPDVPPAVADLCGRLLAKDRAERPRDGTVVASEIAALGRSAAARPQAAEAAAMGTGERRLVCVVFAPGASSSTSETIPAQTWAVLGARLAWLVDGSAMAVLDGAGDATALAARGARAALSLRGWLGDVPMSIATGTAELGEALPVGEVIDRAAEQAQRGGGLRIDEVTAGLLGAGFDVVRDAQGLLLAGEREDSGIVRTLLGRETTTVGRNQELRLLESTLTSGFAEPAARAIVLSGAPGVGKSRLRWELLRRLAARPARAEVWIGRGDPSSPGSPLALLAEALRHAMGVRVGEPPEVSYRKVEARVARHVPEADRARVAQFLGELVGAPFPGEPSTQLAAARQDPGTMGEPIVRAVEDLIEAESRARPLLLVLEDLQWGDRPTTDVVHRLLRNLAARPFAVLAVARPEALDLFPGLWADRGVVTMRIGRLAPRAARELAREVLGPEPEEARVQGLIERADGNAFLLEELLRAAAEGRWDAVPATGLAVAQARLEGLEPDARRLLRAASVLGERCWPGAVEALTGDEAAKVAASLDRLAEREVLTRRARSRFPAEREYAFRHALVREAAYSMLTAADLALGHRLAAGWLRRMGESDALVLARHWEAGGERAEACRSWLRAAEQALERHDLPSAHERAQQAATLGAAGRELGVALLIQADALMGSGRNAECAARALEALELLSRGSKAWFEAAHKALSALGNLGDRDRSEAVAARARGTSPGEPGAPSARFRVLAVRAVHLYFAGEGDAAEALLGEIEREYAGSAEVSAAARASIEMARAYRAVHRGDPVGRVRAWEAVVQSWQDVGQERYAVNARVELGYAYLELGLGAVADPLLRTALAEAQRMGLASTAALAHNNLGLVLLRQGEPARAVEVETIAAEAYRAQGAHRLEGDSRCYLAEALALCGRLAEAEREARAAVGLVAQVPYLRPLALVTLARVLARAGQREEARASAIDAMKALQAVGAVEEGEALVRLTHAEALDESGDRAAACLAIAEARARIVARAERISEPSWRESFLTVTEHAETLRRADEWLRSGR